MVDRVSVPRFPRVPSMCEVVGTSLIGGLTAAILSLRAERLADSLQSKRTALIIIHVVFAIGCAAVVFVVRYKDRNRRLQYSQRLELMAASIEQIRQALQLIVDSAVAGTREQRIVLYAVEHIEWVLNEALPAVNETPRQVRDRMNTQGNSQVS